ncbi:MAG TPA: hypothetical protein VKR24_04520 [Candidatus Limnocylindrales bacterium]|nr:hypothetical protein [Candidatus Limnocylindrales bacterium]
MTGGHALMVLVAGEQQEILIAIGTDDLASLADRRRFSAHLSLGAGLDPTWLDLFSEAVRSVTGTDEPRDFLDARRELDSVGAGGPGGQAGELPERTIERVDPRWVEAIARLDDSQVDRVAGRWIDLLDEELGDLPREEKPWIRQLAGELVAFCRAALRGPDILFAWSL